MTTRRIAHLGIAVASIDDALRVWRDALGLAVTHRETVAEQGVRTAFLPVGDSAVELLEPVDGGGPMGKFIAARGEGIHHVALAVDDVAAALERARAAGLRLIDETPRRGAGGALVAFLHPKSTGGVLVELVQGGPGRAGGQAREGGA